MNTVAGHAQRDMTRPAAIAAAALIVFMLASKMGAPVVLALCAIAASCIIAWQSPSATLSIFFFALLAMDRDIQSMLPEGWKMIPVGGAQLRYSDPTLAAMVLVTGIRGYGVLLTRARRLDGLEVLTWAFAAVLGAYAFFGIGRHGIAAPGEMRTYYGVVLVVAYILASVRTTSDAVLCWNRLYWLGLALVAVSIWRGWVLHRLAIGPETRWITAHSNLALNLACVVPLFVPRHALAGQLKARPWTAWVIGGMALILTLINPHRSVWLATSLALAAIVLSGGLSVRRLLSYAGMVGAAAAVSALVVLSAGFELDAFLQERLRPFTSGFYYDANSAWRLGLWLEALVAVDDAGAWVFGLGFGQHFGLRDLGGEIIRTSPHNAYITVYYHMGLAGLALSLLWLGALTTRKRALSDPSGILALATLAACLGFSVAYPFPVFGLALVAVAAVGAMRTTKGAPIDAERWTPDPLRNLGHHSAGTRLPVRSDD